MINANMTATKAGDLRDTLSQLSWDPRTALHSAKLAFAKAYWLGLDKTQTIEDLVRFSGSAFLMENRHLLYELWTAVSESIASPEGFALSAS